MSIKSAIQRVKQRSKLPSGDRITPLPCIRCGISILFWNDDAIFSPHYSYKIVCTQCRSAERAENAAQWGRKT